jgi:hypothetical protein
VDLPSRVLNVVLKELAHTENLEIATAKVGSDIERFFVEEESLVDELALMVVFKELDAFSREIAVLAYVLELLSLLMDQLFVEDEKAVIDIDILPSPLEAEVLRNEFPLAVSLVDHPEVGLYLVLQQSDVDAVLANHVPDR